MACTASYLRLHVRYQDLQAGQGRTLILRRLILSAEEHETLLLGDEVCELPVGEPERTS